MQRSLLVADSESWAVEAATSAARAAGLEVVVAATGPDALDRFLECAPAAVILDGMLPVMDGAMAARRIQQTLAGEVTPIVLTWALPDDRPEQLLASHNLTAVLRKPFKASDVAAILEPFIPTFETPLTDIELPQTQSRDVEEHPLGLTLLELKKRSATGRLVVERDGIVKELLFQAGDVVGFASNADRDGWPQWLTRDPALDLQRRQTALRLAEETPFASLEELESVGLVKQAQLDQVRHRRLVSLSLDLLATASGAAYWVEVGVTPETQPVDGYRLALWALRRCPCRPGLERYLPPPGARLKRNWSSPQLDLTALELQVAALADETRTAAEILVLGRLVEVDAGAALARLIATTNIEALPELPGAQTLPRVDLPEELGGRELPSKGELSAVSVPRVLAKLWSTHASGILEVVSESITRALHIRRGEIVQARSNSTEHRLGEILLQSGAISSEELAQASAALEAGGGRRIGTLLVAHGALALKELHDGLVLQLRAIARDAICATEGNFTFLEGSAGTNEEVRAASIPQLVLEACRGLDLNPDHLKQLPGDRDLLLRVWDEAEVGHTFALNADERAVLAKLGPGATLFELLDRCGLDQVDVLRILYALIGLGVVQPLSGETSGTVIGGRENFEDLMGEVGDEEETVDTLDLVGAYRELRSDYRKLETENQRLREALAALEADQTPEQELNKL